MIGRAAGQEIGRVAGYAPYTAFGYGIPRARGMAMVGRCADLVTLARSFSFPSRSRSVPSSLVWCFSRFGLVSSYFGFGLFPQVHVLLVYLSKSCVGCFHSVYLPWLDA